MILDKLIDVKVVCPSGRSHKELINFETQNQDHSSIAKRFWGYGSYMITQHTPRGTPPTQLYSAVSIVVVRDTLSFLKGHAGYEEIFYPTGFQSGVRIEGHTLIIYELGKFKIPFEKLKTDKEKILYMMKHFGTLTQEQRDKLRETGGVVEEYVDTLEKVVNHPNFEQGYNKWRSIDRDMYGVIHDATEKGRKEGLYKARVDIAMNLLNKGYSVTDVSQDTGLSNKEVSQLKKDL